VRVDWEDKYRKGRVCGRFKEKKYWINLYILQHSSCLLNVTNMLAWTIGK
jgi:hypothetical protein